MQLNNQHILIVKIKLKQFDKFLKSMNYFLNKDGVAILKIRKRNKNFHARFSAKIRIYKYIIINRLSGPVLKKIEAGI